MFCRNCKNEVHEEAVVCVKCGVPTGKGNNYCPKCGNPTEPEAVFCVSCGVSLKQDKQPAVSEGKSRLAAGLLAIFLGIFGIHNFYLGFNKRGVGQLILTLVGSILCGLGPVVCFIWTLIEGIQYLAGTRKTDADGNPLTE